MSRARLPILLPLLWLMLSTLVVGAEKTVVFEFGSVGLDSESALAATQIFRNELTATGEFALIPVNEVEAKLSEQGITDLTCTDLACAVRYGSIVGADRAVIGSLTRLGQKITAEVTLVDVAQETIAFTDHFPASSLDDLDNVLRKLAGAVASGREIESEVTRFAISDAEAGEPRRKKAHITSGASFGFGFPIGDSYAKVDNIKILTWSLRYEAGRVVVDNSVGINWGSTGTEEYGNIEIDNKRITVIPWDIGVRYLLSRESDFAPFVGGGIGLHFIASVNAPVTDAQGAQEGEDIRIAAGDTAPAIHLAGGIYGFQTYDFRLVLEVKYTVVFSDAFIGSEDSSSGMSVSIGISRKFDRDEDQGCTGGGCLF
jgi:hypothetical protein